VWEKTGGYDTEFAFQGEDFDWQVRAKQHGYKIMYTPNAKLWHKESMTIGKSSPFKIYYDTRNNLLVRLKHRDENYFRTYFYWYLKNFIIKPLLKYSIKLKLLYSFNIIKGFFSVILWGFRNRKITIKHFVKF